MNTAINPKLIWLCRRGMKELDEVLQPYLQNHYLNATKIEQQAFQQLLAYQDPDIIERLFYGKKDNDIEIEKLLEKLRY